MKKHHEDLKSLVKTGQITTKEALDRLISRAKDSKQASESMTARWLRARILTHADNYSKS